VSPAWPTKFNPVHDELNIFEGHNNDLANRRAIAKAMRRRTMQSVAKKSVDQLDLQVSLPNVRCDS
jgi:hypothetical protein